VKVHKPPQGLRGKDVALMIGVAGVGDMTKPIAIGLFVAALFVAAYLVNRPQA
jgi:hypothetical protein